MTSTCFFIILFKKEIQFTIINPQKPHRKTSFINLYTLITVILFQKNRKIYHQDTEGAKKNQVPALFYIVP